MTPEEELAARSQLKWQRDGEWVLLYRRRRMGRVYRSLQAIREVAYEQLANDPSKCPVKPGSQKAFCHPCVFLRRLSSGPNETPPKYPYLTATSSHGPENRQPRQSAEDYLELAMPDTEWTSPRKMMDYYMDQSDGMEATQKRLYHPQNVRPHARVS